MGSKGDRDAQSSKERRGPQAPAHDVRRWQVANLLGEAREAIIEHDGEIYRLRLTANNKLILTK
jgi:hemin uptake protein HemP